MHMFNWWADLLRATDEFEDTSGAPYIKWIKDSIAQNKSYKSMVHELISATGGGWQMVQLVTTCATKECSKTTWLTQPEYFWVQE